MKVCIVGGGVAGMTTAYRLMQDGHEVSLYEASPYLGGLVRTFDVGGSRLEAYYHHIFSTDTTIVKLDSVRAKLDVPARAKESFAEHKSVWLGGSALVGFLLSKIPARSKTVVIERGAGLAASGKFAMLWDAAKFAGAVARPFIGDLTSERINELLRRFSKKSPPPPNKDAAA